MEVLIRRAIPGDLAALVELNATLFRDDAGQRDPFADLAWPAKEGEAYFAGRIGDDAILCLVAENQGQIVGALVGYVKSPRS